MANPTTPAAQPATTMTVAAPTRRQLCEVDNGHAIAWANFAVAVADLIGHDRCGGNTLFACRLGPTCPA